MDIKEGSSGSDIMAAIGRKMKKSTQNPKCCPFCNKNLTWKTVPGIGRVYGHEKEDKCSHTFSSVEEIETAKRMLEEKQENGRDEEKKRTMAEMKPQSEDLDPPIVKTISLAEYQDSRKEKDALKHTDAEGNNVNDNEPGKERKHIRRLKSDKEEDMAVKRAVLVKEEKKPGQAETFTPVVTGRDDTSELSDGLQEAEDEDEYGKTQVLSSVQEEEQRSEENLPSLTNKETGEIIDIDKPVFRIGKKKDCSLRLPDNKAVSRVHAELLLKNGTCYIKDLDSTNGTFVNELQLPKETEMEVKDGDVLKFANQEFLLTIER